MLSTLSVTTHEQLLQPGHDPAMQATGARDNDEYLCLLLSIDDSDDTPNEARTSPASA